MRKLNVKRYTKGRKGNMKSGYQKYADKTAPRSPIIKNSIRAFVTGGGICVIGEALAQLYKRLGADKENAYMLVSLTVVLVTTILTGIGVFDKIGKFAGAGVLVPISGFANAVVAPAIDNKAEGLVLGLGAKIFIIAGPVILYGTLASSLYGLIYAVYLMLG